MMSDLMMGKRCFAAVASIFMMVMPAMAETIIIQSTTSTQNSGLYDVLLPQFMQDTGIDARVVAVGTGQAIENAKRCDGDVLLVHAMADELKFIKDGYGVRRDDVMYNDFVLIGPKSDVIGVAESATIIDALQLIARANARFASRGDDSGTHKKELNLWARTGVNVGRASGTWYREMGAGMGATLNAAVGMNAYTLSDRATWVAFENKQNHGIIFEGDDDLFNQYGIITLSVERCPNIKHQSAQIFIDWILSEKGQSAIANYKRFDQQLFFPNAQKP